MFVWIGISVGVHEINEMEIIYRCGLLILNPPFVLRQYPNSVFYFLFFLPSNFGFLVICLNYMFTPSEEQQMVEGGVEYPFPLYLSHQASIP